MVLKKKKLNEKSDDKRSFDEKIDQIPYQPTTLTNEKLGNEFEEEEDKDEGSSAESIDVALKTVMDVSRRIFFIY